MAVTKTLQNLLDGVRFAVRRQQTSVVPDADLTPIVNEEIRNLWVYCGRLNRDEYWKVSAQFTITAGQNTKTLAAMGVTDFLDLRGVDVQTGSSEGTWMPIKPYSFRRRGYVGQLSYRMRGTTLEIRPPDIATTYPYRIHYTYQPTALVNVSDTVDLPMAGDAYVIQGVAAKVRPSFSEDPAPHIALQAAAEAQVKRWLTSHGQGPPERVPEADPFDDDDWWYLGAG